MVTRWWWVAAAVACILCLTVPQWFRGGSWPPISLHHHWLDVRPLSRRRPPTVALGLYLEMRTLPDNLALWKRYLVDHVASEGGTVDVFVCVAARSKGNDTAATTANHPALDHLFWRAVADTGLNASIVAFEYYPFDAVAAYAAEMVALMEHHNGTGFGTPETDLFAQYYMRHRLNQMLHAHLFGDRRKPGRTYDLVVYSRSDIALGSPILEDVLTDVRSWTFRNGATDPKHAVVWQPVTGQFTPLCINDRLNVFSALSFRLYQERFLDRVGAYVRRGGKGSVHGETMHGWMLMQFTTRALVHDVMLCYGVRRFKCDWTVYGDDGCEYMRLLPLKHRRQPSYLCPALGSGSGSGSGSGGGGLGGGNVSVGDGKRPAVEAASDGASGSVRGSGKKLPWLGLCRQSTLPFLSQIKGYS